MLGTELLMPRADEGEDDVNEGEEEMGDVVVDITPFLPIPWFGVCGAPVGNAECAE